MGRNSNIELFNSIDLIKDGELAVKNSQLYFRGATGITTL